LCLKFLERNTRYNNRLKLTEQPNIVPDSNQPSYESSRQFEEGDTENLSSTILMKKGGKRVAVGK